MRKYILFKCYHCGFTLLLDHHSLNYTYACENCKSTMTYSKEGEKFWLKEKDENGNQIRQFFKGNSINDCIKKASSYFNCGSSEFRYYITKGNPTFKHYTILAWKPKYDLTPNMTKIIISQNPINKWIEWIAVDPVKKIIIATEYNNGRPIKYNRIVSIKCGENNSDDFDKCKIILDPSYELELHFEVKNLANFRTLIDILYESIPVENHKEYTSGYFRRTDIAKSVEECCLEENYSFGRNFNTGLNGYCIVWKDDTYLSICYTNSHYGTRIKLEDINYYRIIGEKYVTTEISGGGGGGTSIKGAILGSLIAGTTGAIIGSREKIDKIQSYSDTMDKQAVLIYFKQDDLVLSFSSSLYTPLLKILPEKEYMTTTEQNPANIKSENTNSSNRNIEMLTQLNSLYEQGILTKEDFEEKKKDILSRI